jgi:hypothetical protein
MTIGGRLPRTPSAGAWAAGDVPGDVEDWGAGAGGSSEQATKRQAKNETAAAAGRARFRALPFSNDVINTAAILNEPGDECQRYSRWLTQET